MASPIANTFLTFDAVGIREELSDVIYQISPEDTPFVSMASKERVGNTLYEWQTDALKAVDTGNAHLEGDDITVFEAVVPTVRVAGIYALEKKTDERKKDLKTKVRKLPTIKPGSRSATKSEGQKAAGAARKRLATSGSAVDAAAAIEHLFDD